MRPMNTASSMIVAARQRGVTLTELMIALVLGALVVLAATAMVVSSRGSYRSQDENTRLAEASRFGLELSDRMVRLAGFVNWGSNNNVPATYQPDPTWAAAPDAYAMNGPNIVGANNLKPGGASGLNGSDSLTIRYFGSSPPQGVPPWPLADGNVLDCAGTAVPDPPASVSATALASAVGNSARAYNVLYVDTDTDGEPSLFCQRQLYDPTTGLPTGAFQSQALIRGVEDFQVLYGEYIPPVDGSTGLPLSLDDNPPQSIVYRTGIGGPNPVVNWSNVRSVRIAMLLRSATGARTDPEATTVSYKLFGAAYAAATSSDPGATFSLSALSTTERTRVRRIVETTVFVRNRENQWSSVQFN